MNTSPSVGSTVTTFGSILNAAYLLEDSPLTVSGLLDLFSVFENIIFNEKIFTIPINNNEFIHHENMNFISSLVENKILYKHVFTDREEETISKEIVSEIELINTQFPDDILAKILNVMKAPIEHKGTAYNEFYIDKSPIETKNNGTSKNIFNEWQSSTFNNIDGAWSGNKSIDFYMLGRMFLYINFSNENRIGFTPDFSRTHIVNNYFQKQNTTVAQQLYSTVKEKWLEDVLSRIKFGNFTTLPIPPIGVIALEKCKRSKKDLLEVILELRDEFSSLRNLCHELEVNLLQGNLRDSKKAEVDIKKISKIICSKYNAEAEERFIVNSIKGLQKLVKIILNPKDTLSLDPEIVFDLLSKRTANQFFSLYKKAQHIKCGNKEIKEVFGRGVSEKELSLIVKKPKLKFFA